MNNNGQTNIQMDVKTLLNGSKSHALSGYPDEYPSAVTHCPHILQTKMSDLHWVDTLYGNQVD